MYVELTEIFLCNVAIDVRAPRIVYLYSVASQLSYGVQVILIAKPDPMRVVNKQQSLQSFDFFTDLSTGIEL